MDYELAKQLRAAGFPQRIKKCDKFFDALGYEAFWLENEDLEFHYPDMTAVKFPSLSELVAACGDRFGYFFNQEIKRKWQAGNKDFDAYGETPEEAVARLYLALHPNAADERSESPSHPTTL